MSAVTDQMRIAILIQAGVISGQIMLIDDATLDDLIAHHEEDFAYTHVLIAIKNFKTILTTPPVQTPQKI